jgi:hypothetical protein
LSYNCPPNSLWSCLWSCLRWSNLSQTQQRVWTFFIANASCWHQCKNSDLKIILYNSFCCVVSFLFYLPLCTREVCLSSFRRIHLSIASWVISLRVPSWFFYSSSLSFWTFLSTHTFFPF